jgi:alkyl hydroperoxide reductase subunit F
MLDASLKAQLTDYMQRITQPVEIVAFLDDGDKSRELRELLQEIGEASPKISYAESQSDEAVTPAARVPSFTLHRAGSDVQVTFAGIPLGHEFTSLVLALLQVGGYPAKLDADAVQQIQRLEGDYAFETYMSLSCQNCPDVVQALNAMSIINPRIRHVAIDGALFQAEVEKRNIMAVPTVYLNGEVFGQGRMDVEEILQKLDTGAAARAAEKLNDKAPFDVLVIGGGPAGATAAVYAARKGIRTGVLAERFGGQVNDTMAIENFISMPHTEGPKLAVALEAHVRAYDVDIIRTQRAAKLVPGELIEVQTESGATLRAKSVILATGARWRNVGVPGEDAYRNKGVAYCPHCDGPLFKGKRVAVIGGGNSGVEAAIDLAGIVTHVTLIEFDTALRADDVLQRKLRSLPNVSIHTNAQTTEIIGDGQKVTGLAYAERASGEQHHVELEGVFVQIGLVPNTDWLKGASLALSARGEIEIDARGQTSVPGVFAAGDATTVPFKQIVIAMGEGAKASLAAFDYLIRQSAGQR